ncbi:PREDICTED: xyloside xylosyltransferase 1, partial [Fulmarus glacialis]
PAEDKHCEIPWAGGRSCDPDLPRLEVAALRAALPDSPVPVFPLCRHTFWQYRRENPQTKVGDPPPDGLPGFNSGVLLLNLEAMRQSKLYNQLLEPAMVQKLTEKYHFKGHLGDQDFFTMVGMEHPELFHVLDCTWNRQLCTWWRDHGYSDVFDQYFQCEGEVKIYHGNCNTPIPED